MLILTRKQNQSLNIGDGIRIKILQIGTDQVKIGIDAPRDVTVYREEIYQKIAAQNKQAVQDRINTDLIYVAKKLQPKI